MMDFFQTFEVNDVQDGDADAVDFKHQEGLSAGVTVDIRHHHQCHHHRCHYHRCHYSHHRPMYHTSS